MQFHDFFDVTQILRAGVYILCFEGKVVYIGKSKRMYSRIYAHKNITASKRAKEVPSWLPIKGVLFDEVHVRPCAIEQLNALERQYINLYKPRYNIHLKRKGEKVKLPVGFTTKGILQSLCARAPKAPTIRRRV